MNLDESSGGSSCNGQENGDGYNGSERPLKKARFAWQVKGKYHLKNEDNDTAKISATECTAPEMAGPSGSGSNSSNIDNIGTEQDIKTIGGYIVNKNFDAFNSLDNNPGKYGFKPYMFPTDDNSDELEFVSMSMVASENYTEDQCIARWQARQMAKGPLDNTINAVLEYIKENPLEEGDATLEAFDVADIINNRPGVRENSIENEGILMAISAHGLQNTSNSSSSFNSVSSSSFNSVSSSMSLDINEICLPRIRSPAPSFSFSPVHSEDESNEEIQGEFEYALDKWPYADELKNENKVTIETPTFHGTPSLIFQNLYENLHNTEAASNDMAIEDDNHRDFLDAAVLFAIQSKGLTTFGTDYG